MRKISEIFLNYVEPLRSEPHTRKITAQYLEKLYRIPIITWNLVNMDKNKNRKAGELPENIKLMITSEIPERERLNSQMIFAFWVNRKDLHFAEHSWGLNIEIVPSKQIQDQLIVRASSVELNNQSNSRINAWLKNPCPSETLM